MKTPVLKSLFDKVAGFQVCNFIKKRLQHSCFLVIFAKFLKTPLFTEHPTASASGRIGIPSIFSELSIY